MNKVFFVMDDPRWCSNCPIATQIHDKWFCWKGICDDLGDYQLKPVDMDSRTRPDWCPLKPLPDKVEVFMDDWAEGYNACLGDILDT